MFFYARQFHSDISRWNTSSVQSMMSMFPQAYNFNADLSAWDTHRVTDMAYMFQNAKAFNSDISSWDVSSVTSMNNILEGAESFHQNLCRWGTESSNLVTASDAFRDSACTNPSSPDLRRSIPGPFCEDCGKPIWTSTTALIVLVLGVSILLTATLLLWRIRRNKARTKSYAVVPDHSDNDLEMTVLNYLL